LLLVLAGFAAISFEHFRISMALGIALMVIGILFMVVEITGMLMIAITGAPLLALATLITIVSFPFGLDTALLAPLFEVSAETTPPGKATIVELSAELAGGLWHSSPYGSAEAFHEIALWIKAHQRTERRQ